VATFVHNTVGLLAPEAREAGVTVQTYLDRRPVLKVGVRENGRLWGAWTGGLIGMRQRRARLCESFRRSPCYTSPLPSPLVPGRRTF